ncbi:Uncharacterised protein (plasmid) [Legionella adelaidensis]|uniref:Uncharacterized protein n=1 Tax=Legionella adelaidensis TaxID=45056 RepID=A0A0W0R3X6_9GAMM|nr:hypothetical protein [Legionella adelaidensis]KTC65751.1 hypothetical protein Lade_0409 [Legionella adelaidensis]VEH85083.1 Uncharacterised protein [Legionella adelaidensis]
MRDRGERVREAELLCKTLKHMAQGSPRYEQVCGLLDYLIGILEFPNSDSSFGKGKSVADLQDMFQHEHRNKFEHAIDTILQKTIEEIDNNKAVTYCDQLKDLVMQHRQYLGDQLFAGPSM